jgi:hypothetical protein
MPRYSLHQPKSSDATVSGDVLATRLRESRRNLCPARSARVAGGPARQGRGRLPQSLASAALALPIASRAVERSQVAGALGGARVFVDGSNEEV